MSSPCNVVIDLWTCIRCAITCKLKLMRICSRHISQVQTDLFKGALPLAAGSRAGAGVRSELTSLLVLYLLSVKQRDHAAA